MVSKPADKFRLTPAFSKILVTICSLLILSGCLQQSQTIEKEWQSPLLKNHPLNGQIFDINNNSKISYSQLIEQLGNYRYILIGEKHDNPDHHQLERQLLGDLQRNSATRVVLEMLNQQQSTGFDQLDASSSNEEIKDALHWPDKGWPWKDYSGLVVSALQNNNDIRGGNLKRSLLMDIYRGAKPDEARFTTVSKISSDIKQTILKQVYESHCKTIPTDQLAPMVEIQISRDASMAYNLTQKLTSTQQAILFTGGFHGRKDTGVTQHLIQLGADKREIITVQLVEADENALTAQDYPFASPQIADYIMFTPKYSDQDYCAPLRKKAEH